MIDYAAASGWPSKNRIKPEATELKGCARISHLTKLIITECGKDAKYIVCFFGGSVVRLVAILFSNFLVLWITSFVDDGTITEEESKDLY